MSEYLTQVISFFNNVIFVWASLLFLFIFFFIETLSKKNKILFTKNLRYQGKQRVHEGEIPRAGGIIIFLSLLTYAFLLETENVQEELQLICICLLPMMIVILKEDFFHNVDFRLRFCALALSVILLLSFVVDTFPVVDYLYLISNLFEIPAFNFIFYALCLIGLANGFNFIDGMNGLLAFYIMSALICCLQLAFIVGDQVMPVLIIIYFFLMMCFLFLNFPFGRIFMGDAGAYLMGLLLGIWVIKFFATYDTISSWNAGLIFFYPAIEVVFSFTRKLIQHKSPFKPDREHLHLKVFDILNTALKKPRLANNLTTVFLALFYLTPTLLLPWVYDNQTLIFLTLIILTFSYLVLNIVIPEKTTYAKT